MQIRPIEPGDNVELAKVIRTALTEFGANKPGTVYFDPTTDALYELFRTPGSFYFVATIDQKVVGGCGIFPTDNLPEGTCELVKLYVAKEARGTGLGKQLMEKSMNLIYRFKKRFVVIRIVIVLSNQVFPVFFYAGSPPTRG